MREAIVRRSKTSVLLIWAFMLFARIMLIQYTFFHIISLWDIFMKFHLVNRARL